MLRTCSFTTGCHFGADRLRLLLARGFQLSQVIEQWHRRAIWVVGATDDAYPSRLRRLEKSAPTVLYGCGDPALLDQGGLAVVGSRRVDEDLITYAEGIGRLTARSEHMLVSGGARGIDQAVMRGALEAGGQVLGILSNDLQRAALHREHRELLIDGQLLLVSPYDPAAGFNVGNAMHRNKDDLRDGRCGARSEFGFPARGDMGWCSRATRQTEASTSLCSI